MRNIRKILGVCTAVFALAVALVMAPMDAQAAELTAPEEEAATTETVAPATEVTIEEALRSIFSAEYYASKNPDVVALLGDDEEVLYQHYLEFGIPEGRDVSPIIDIRAYRIANPDLIERYGNDLKAILSQFVTEGVYQMAEGTRPSVGVRFNPVTFLNAHPDAMASTNGNLLKVIELFISDGMPAGIWADPAITGGEETDSGIKVMDTLLSKNDAVFADNLMMSAPIVFEPQVEDTFVVDVNTTDKNSGLNSGSSGGNQTTSDKTDTPVKQPDTPKPTCNHAEVFCGNTCNVCNQVIGHDFGESGTDPYCTKCNADFVQVQGCNHVTWSGGTCTLCWKVDSYYTFHDTMHPDEVCPDCGYVGTVKYETDKCPGHDYGDGDVCVLCGEAKPQEDEQLPDEDEVLDEDAQVEEAVAMLLMLTVDDTIVADAAVVEGEDVVLDEEVIVESEAVIEEAEAEEEDATGVEETVEVVDTDTEEPEVAAENTDDEDTVVVDESVESTDGAGAGDVEVGGAEVIEFTGPADGAADAEEVIPNAAAEAA